MNLTHESVKTVLQYLCTSSDQSSKGIICLYGSSEKQRHEQRIIFENWVKLYPDFSPISSRELESIRQPVRVNFKMLTNSVNTNFLKGSRQIIMLCPDWHFRLSYEKRYEINFVNGRHNLNEPT